MLATVYHQVCVLETQYRQQPAEVVLDYTKEAGVETNAHTGFGSVRFVFEK